MKNISSKRAKACAISQKTKRRVYDRDGGCCIICGRPGLPEAHVVPRSRGGLGREENIVTLCRECHMQLDQGGVERSKAMHECIRNYLKSIYPDWTEEEQVYRKYE